MTESVSTYQRARQWLRERNIQRLTWNDVDTFIRENEFDHDEYFEVHTVYRHHHTNWTEEFVYGDKIRWIAVYWVVGGSEGYYALGRP